MSLEFMELNASGEGYRFKEFDGPNIQQMPLLIAEGRTPLSVAGLMKRYLEVLDLYKTAPEEFKTLYNSLLKAWGKHSFDSGDGAVRTPNGDMYVAPDAQYLRLLTPETKLVRGAIDLSTGYTLGGERFSEAAVDKYCGKPLRIDEVKTNPIWLALARGDKALLGEFVDARFARAKEQYYFNGEKMMGIRAPSIPKEGAVGRLWAVVTIGYGDDNSVAYGNGSLNGRFLHLLVGEKLKAQSAAPRTLEQRVPAPA